MRFSMLLSVLFPAALALGCSGAGHQGHHDGAPCAHGDKADHAEGCPHMAADGKCTRENCPHKGEDGTCKMHHGAEAGAASPAAAAPAIAIATIGSASGSQVRGSLKFVQDGEKLTITGQFEGLTPGQKHAMHVHEFGDCSSGDGKSAGGHYNPEGHAHGLPDRPQHHAGDLGNLEADAAGKATYALTIEHASLFGTNALIGRGVIVHAKTDDGGQPTGNAGDRIGCGVIGVAAAPKP